MANDKKTPLYNYKSPGDYKVFNMGNEASPPFKMKYSNSAFPFKSPLKEETALERYSSRTGGLGSAKEGGLSGDKVGANAPKFGGEATDLGGGKTLTPKASGNARLGGLVADFGKTVGDAISSSARYPKINKKRA
tara:strand:+ start:40 stop:444 length:405 start_codon:yes stop_codon:yes gene_type:complete